MLIRSNIVLTSASILFNNRHKRYGHNDIKVTAGEQVRYAKAGIHHRKFSFHHGRNNIGMIVLKRSFQLILGLNFTSLTGVYLAELVVDLGRPEFGLQNGRVPTKDRFCDFIPKVKWKQFKFQTVIFRQKLFRRFKIRTVQFFWKISDQR